MTARAIVIIGDIVRSRELRNRRSSQLHLTKLLMMLNQKLEPAIIAPFTITLGDEFEGVVRDLTAFPELVTLVEGSFPDAAIRLGVGIGSISTRVTRSPLEMDGQAFHNARFAIDAARKENALGGVFKGFGAEQDRILNGFARLLHHHRSRLTPRQRQVLELLRSGQTQAAVARRLRVTESAVSQAARAFAWQAFSEAEDGFRAALSLLAKKASVR